LKEYDIFRQVGLY